MTNTHLHIGAGEEKKAVKAVDTQPKGTIERINAWLLMHSKVKIKQKVIFYRLLSTMVMAGLSLIRALIILEEETEQPKLKYVIGMIHKRIEGGESLSAALLEYPDVFTPQEIGMIKSGEVSGRLSQILLQLADEIEKTATVRAKIKGAMMYPIFIILVIMTAGIVVMVMVIPKIAELFETANVELPLLTQILINTSDFFVATTIGIPNWIYMILALIAAYFSIRIFRSTEKGAFMWDKMLLAIPIFGSLIQKVALTNFCRGLSSLTSSGISIVKALQIVADSVGNNVYKKRIHLVSEDVKKGITIADNLRGEKKLFPTMVVSMLGIGEKTAQLHTVAGKIAKFYEDEVDNMVSNLSKLMEPFIIVVIGAGVGLLVAAVMIPIMKIAEVASQG